MKKIYHILRDIVSGISPELSLWGCLTILLSSIWYSGYFYIYQARDIDRAVSILSGNFISHGPELNGGGALPGPAYYYILALLYAILPSWKWLWACMIMFCAAGICSLVYVLRRFFGDRVALTWLLLSICSLPLLWVLRQFINPSFLILPVCVYFVFLYYRSRDVYSLKHSFWGGLILGISLQLHMQSIVLLVPYLAMVLHLNRSKKNSETLQDLAFFFLGFGSAFCFAYLSTSVELPGSSGSKNNFIYDFYKTFLNELNESDKRYIRKVTLALTAIFFPMIIFLFDKKGEPWGKWEKSLLLAVLLSIPALLFYTFFEGRARYCIVFTISLALLLSARSRSLSQSNWYLFIFATISLNIIQRISPSNISIMMGLSLLFIFLFLALNKVRIKYQVVLPALAVTSLFVTVMYFKRGHFSDRGNIMPTFSMYRSLGATIKKHTNWTKEEALSRVFYFDFFNQATPRWIWNEFLQNPDSNRREANFDGLFVINKALKVSFPNEQLQSHLAKALLKEERDGYRIKILPPIYDDADLSVIPYKWGNREKVIIFQNLGSPYLTDSGADALQDVMTASNRSPTKTELWSMGWNGCEGGKKYCWIGIFVEKINKIKWRVNIVGEPISVPSINTIPDFTVAIRDIWIEWSCGGSTKPIHMNFVKNIGYYLPKTFSSQRIHVLNHSLTGPLFIDVMPPCAGASPLRAGWDRTITTKHLVQSNEVGFSDYFKKL